MSTEPGGPLPDPRCPVCGCLIDCGPPGTCEECAPYLNGSIYNCDRCYDTGYLLAEVREGRPDREVPCSCNGGRL